MFAGLVTSSVVQKVRDAPGTYLMSLCTTPRVWRNSMPLRSDLNQTLAMGSSTSTGMRRGR